MGNKSLRCRKNVHEIIQSERKTTLYGMRRRAVPGRGVERRWGQEKTRACYKHEKRGERSSRRHRSSGTTWGGEGERGDAQGRPSGSVATKKKCAAGALLQGKGVCDVKDHSYNRQK